MNLKTERETIPNDTKRKKKGQNISELWENFKWRSIHAIVQPIAEERG